MPKKKPTQLPDYIKLSKYATLKGISRTTLYRHIDDGKIVCEYIGKDADPYIDLSLYKDYQFAK